MSLGFEYLDMIQSHPRRVLLVYLQFISVSSWNDRATCEIVGAKDPAAPLGLITNAALLPQDWEMRVITSAPRARFRCQ